MFIANIRQPLFWSRALSVPFSLFRLSFHFVLGWGGIGAARRLCGSVIRKGGRESASQQDSLFYIHQKSCLWFAPSLTCDSMDCSTTLLLRKSCTYHPPLPHHPPHLPTLFSFLSFLPSSIHAPLPTWLLQTVTAHPPPTSTPRSLTLRPVHQLINFSIIIDIAALLKSDFCQGHSSWECAPASSSHLPSWETDR